MRKGKIGTLRGQVNARGGTEGEMWCGTVECEKKAVFNDFSVTQPMQPTQSK